MFDDTVYYVSFATEQEATQTLERMNSSPIRELLTALVFMDEKRPIKTAVLNRIDWGKLADDKLHAGVEDILTEVNN